MKRTLFLALLLMAGMGWGATGQACSAGFGVNTSATTAGINTTNDTYIDTSFPALVAGNATRYVCKLYKGSTVADEVMAALTSAKIKVFRLDGSDYDLVGECTVTAHVKAAAVAAGTGAARFTYDTSATYSGVSLTFDDDATGLPIEIQAGDFIGWFSDALVYVGVTTNTGYNCRYETDVVKNDITTTMVAADAETLADRSFTASLIVSTEENILFNSDGGGDGFVKNEVIHVPGFSTEPFYVIFEGVSVANGEDAKITASYINASNAIASDVYIHVDMTQAAGADILKECDKAATVYGSKTITYATGDKYTISCCIYPNFLVGLYGIQSLAVNYVNGQGLISSALDSADTAHFNIGGNAFNIGTFKGDTNIWRWTLTQVTGDAATIDRIIVVRKPVIAIGDSFCSSKSAGNPVVKARVSTLLDDYWSSDNYVINGGTQGIPLVHYLPTMVNPAIASQFYSIGYAVGTYPYARYIFVDGPCINDIATAAFTPTSNASAITLGKTAAHAVGYMAGLAKRNNCEVVLSEVCYLEAGHALQNAYTDLAVKTFNTYAKNEAALLGIPFAIYADRIKADGDTYYNADHIHLSNDGDALLATSIVSAFENNQIPSNPFGSGKSTPFGTGSSIFGN
jgi:hypothetical protein